MNVYTLVLYAHVVGAIGYCISIGAWLLLLVGLRRAQRVEEARALMRVNDLSGPIGAASALLLLIAGLDPRRAHQPARDAPHRRRVDRATPERHR